MGEGDKEVEFKGKRRGEREEGMMNILFRGTHARFASRPEAERGRASSAWVLKRSFLLSDFETHTRVGGSAE